MHDAVKELNKIDGFQIVMLKNKYQNPTPVRGGRFFSIVLFLSLFNSLTLHAAYVSHSNV